MLIVAGVCLVFAFALQPVRERFDDDRKPGRSFQLSDIKAMFATMFP